METIYLITKTLEVNSENQFRRAPSSWAASAEEARETLSRTIERFREIHSDLEVLDQTNNSLHILYTDEQGQENYISYWVHRVSRSDIAW